MPVNRGPSLASASAAIAAALVADIEATQERSATAWRRHEEAVRAVMRYPERVALVDTRGRPSE